MLIVNTTTGNFIPSSHDMLSCATSNIVNGHLKTVLDYLKCSADRLLPFM